MNMVVKKLLIKVMLLCLLIFLGSLITVYAQGSDEDVEDAPIVVAPSGRLDLTLGQLGYGNEELNGQVDRCSYRIYLPGNFQISPTGNYFDLVTSHLLETPDRTASLQVEVNNRPLSAITLTADNAISNTVRINLPEGLLRTGRNSITLDLDTGASCEKPGAAIEVLVEEASTLSFGYQQNPYPADLSLYPFPFVERSLLNIPVTIVLPDQPTSDDLSAAATVAAGLGRMSADEIDLTAIPARDLGPDILSNNHLIVIGQPDDNSLLSDLELPFPIGNRMFEPGQGILQEIVSPWNEFRVVLVVSGLDDEGVFKASHALNRQVHFLGMRGPVAIVIELLPLSKSDTPPGVSLTLASLGYDEDEIVYGVAPQQFTFWFGLPPGWQLEELPFFVLKFAHAGILEPYRSIIEVKLNRVPIGSTFLDESNVSQGELTVFLPRHQLETGNNRLQVAVEMNLPGGDKCIDADNERAWTVISNQSEIFLPYNATSLSPNLRHFPYPFSQKLGFDQTLFVLPDQPSPSIFNDVIQLAAQMGRASQPEYISPRVAYASEVDEAVRKQYHLILLGRPTENALFHEVNTYLPQPFVPDSDLLEPLAVDSVFFLPDHNRGAGLLEIITSPWDENYSLLAVTGTTNEGFHLAFQTLLERTSSLRGNLAVVEPVIDPLSDEPNQVSTYAVDTRPPTPVEEASADNMISESDLARLAERWWK